MLATQGKTLALAECGTGGLIADWLAEAAAKIELAARPYLGGFNVISREISFIGNLVGTYVDLQDLMTLTAQGKVSLHTTTYPLDAINDAMNDLDNGRLQGRGILVPA